MLADRSTRNHNLEAEPIIDATACFNALWNNRLYGMYIVEVVEGGKDFRFLAFNDAIHQQKGLIESSQMPLEALLGRRLQDLPADIAQPYHQHYISCVRSGHIVEFEIHIPSQSGDTWWNFSVDPVKNAAGEIYQLIITTADITDRRQAEVALHTSQRVLQQVIDAMPLSILWKDRDSVYQGCNLPFAKVAGSTDVTDVVGKTDYDMAWKEEEADWFVACDRKVMNADRAEMNIIEPLLQADGKEAWLSTSKIPLHDSDGQVNGILVMFEDITDKKDAQDQQQRLLAILEATPDVVGITDAVGNHHYLNRAGQILFGVSPDQTNQFHLSDITRSNVAKMLITEALPVATQRGSWHGESIILDSSGQEVPVSQVIICHKTDEGKVAYFSSITRDISDRKAAEALLKDTAERQAVLNEITAQVRNSLDLDTVIATTLMSVHQGLKLDYCGFAWLENTTDAPAWHVIQAIDDTDHGILIGENAGDCLSSDIARLFNQQLTRVDDAHPCTNEPHQAFLNHFGIRSEILIPIRTDADRTGVIICYHIHKPHTWNEGDIELLQAVGNQLAIAINQANLYTQSCQQSQQLTAALDQLKRTQAQIIQAEKMSSLGQMVAGVAHEINNPVNFIHGNLEPAQDYTKDLLGLIDLYQKTYTETTPDIEAELEAVDLDFVKEDLPKLLNSMVVGTARIREIVLSLRNFSRLDEAAVKTVNIHEGINSTLIILNHRIKTNPSATASTKGALAKESSPIEVIKQYGQVPPVDCYPSQLNQVFMNIFANAIDALEHQPQPQLTVTTEVISPNTPEARAIIRIADNGSGIPKHIQPQVLNPFFTTKPVGKGTGMGMSISYQIITEKHGGKLTFTSEAGKGTEFIIDIPVHQPELIDVD